jgi:hypothetical protein
MDKALAVPMVPTVDSRLSDAAEPESGELSDPEAGELRTGSLPPWNRDELFSGSLLRRIRLTPRSGATSCRACRRP